MDEYISELSDTLTGRIQVSPGKIVLSTCARTYAGIDKVADYYLRPDRVWFTDILRVFNNAIVFGYANIIKTLFARIPGIKFLLMNVGEYGVVHSNNKSLIYGFTVILNGEKYNKSVNMYGARMKELMKNVGCTKSKLTKAYYYSYDNVSDLEILFDLCMQ